MHEMPKKPPQTLQKGPLKLLDGVVEVGRSKWIVGDETGRPRAIADYSDGKRRYLSVPSRLDGKPRTSYVSKEEALKHWPYPSPFVEWWDINDVG